MSATFRVPTWFFVIAWKYSPVHRTFEVAFVLIVNVETMQEFAASPVTVASTVGDAISNAPVSPAFNPPEIPDAYATTL
jgi:hypothetical protein